jgi:hypothetical protein
LKEKEDEGGREGAADAMCLRRIYIKLIWL